MSFFKRFTGKEKIEVLEKKLIEASTKIEQLENKNTALSTVASTSQHQLLQEAYAAANMAELRLWEAVETIDDGFAIYNQNNTLIAANHAYLKTFENYSQIKIGVAYEDLIYLAANEGLVETLSKTPKEFTEFMLERWEEDTPDPITVQLTNNRFLSLIDRRGSSGDMVSLCLDITETIRHEKELKHANARTQKAINAQAAFFANINHEIRTPMNGIIGMAELLENTALNSDQNLYVNTIKKSGQSLIRIVNEVLDQSKIQANKLRIHQEAFNLEQSIKDVVTLMQAQAFSKELELIIDYDLFMPSNFISDAGRIRQVLTNLIGNAVKFTTKGNVIIRITGYQKKNQSEINVHISVEDSGAGIQEKELPYIFDDFTQSEHNTTTSQEGTGLGLSITRKIIEALKGEIFVNSTEGVGSCFTVCLPLKIDNRETHNLPQWLKKSSIVDANALSAEILHKQLSALGFDAAIYDTPEQIIEEKKISHIYFIDSKIDPNTLKKSISFIKDIYPESHIFLMGGGPSSVQDMNIEQAQWIKKPLLRTDLIHAISQIIPQQQNKPKADKPLRNIRILCAEDNKVNQLLIRKLIENMNIDLCFADDGKAAVEAFKQTKPDLVFMDISMPHMDGNQATDAIRKLESHTSLTPIAALTAHTPDDIASTNFSAGFDYYLNKPINKVEVIKIIQQVLPSNCLPIG